MNREQPRGSLVALATALCNPVPWRRPRGAFPRRTEDGPGGQCAPGPLSERPGVPWPPPPGAAVCVCSAGLASVSAATPGSRVRNSASLVPSGV